MKVKVFDSFDAMLPSMIADSMFYDDTKEDRWTSVGYDGTERPLDIKERLISNEYTPNELYNKDINYYLAFGWRKDEREHIVVDNLYIKFATLPQGQVAGLKTTYDDFIQVSDFPEQKLSSSNVRNEVRKYVEKVLDYIKNLDKEHSTEKDEVEYGE